MASVRVLIAREMSSSPDCCIPALPLCCLTLCTSRLSSLTATSKVFARSARARSFSLSSCASAPRPRRYCEVLYRALSPLIQSGGALPSCLAAPAQPSRLRPSRHENATLKYRMSRLLICSARRSSSADTRHAAPSPALCVFVLFFCCFFFFFVAVVVLLCV